MLSEEEGVKAIQFLLSINGESESEEASKQSWNLLQDWQKEQTEIVYARFKAILN